MRLDPPVRELLPDLDRVLARAGCPPGRSGGLEDSVREAIGTLGRSAEPAALYRTFTVDGIDQGVLHAGGVKLKSFNLCRVLEGTSSVSFFVATLGPGPEKTLRELSSEGRHLAAFLLDAAASSAVEKLCRKVHGILSGTMSEYGSTVRYAPGYGDFPLSAQATILGILGAVGIGVSLTDGSHMLVPVKSATGVMGWSRRNV
jgi:hypothetical protein